MPRPWRRACFQPRAQETHRLRAGGPGVLRHQRAPANRVQEPQGPGGQRGSGD
ncbi:hypothetical protein HVPorG_04209 [Roseomonas mucosa]|nr:hypothetical protein HVPorG_04209 [Roseomonas mucosa]